MLLFSVLVIDGVIVVEEKPFTQAAAGNREIRCLRFPQDFLNDERACDDDVGTLGREPVDFPVIMRTSSKTSSTGKR